MVVSGLLGPDGRPISSGPPIQSFIDVYGAPSNNNWWRWASAWTDYVINPDTIKLSEYERMEADEFVSSGMDLVVQTIMSRIDDYEHPDPAVEEKVRWELEHFEGFFTSQVAEMLYCMLQFGFVVAEIIWCRRPDGTVGVREIQVLHPDSILMDLHKSGERKNKVRAFYQWRHQAHQVTIPDTLTDQQRDELLSETAQRIPRNKVIHLAHKARFGNPYGRSRLKAAYRPWFIKDVLIRAMGTAMERYGTPIMTANGNIAGTVRYNGEEIGAADYLSRVLSSVTTNSSLVLPKDTVLGVHYAPSGLGKDFLEVISYCNRAIHQAIGLPSLIADAGSVGSYSLGKEHRSTFEMMLQNVLNDLIEGLLEQLIRPLIEVNFGPMDVYGDFQIEAFDAEEMKLVAEASKALLDSGVMDDRRLDDLNRLRQINKLPELTEEDLLAFPQMDLAQMDPLAAPAAPGMPRGFSWAKRQRNRLARRAARWQKPTLDLPHQELADALARMAS